MTRKRTTRILIFVGAVVPIYAIIHWNADRRFERRWASIEVGMSADEVRELLGSPDDVYLPGQVRSNSFVGNLLANWLLDSFLEKWAYGSRSLADRLPILSDISFWHSDDETGSWLAPKDDDYVIYFSADAQVVRKTHRYRQRSQPVNQ